MILDPDDPALAANVTDKFQTAKKAPFWGKRSNKRMQRARQKRAADA